MSAISRDGPHSLYKRFFKRPLDLTLMTATLPVTLPLICMIALLIILESRGPAILRVTRKGKGRTTFRQYRFRCVYLDAADRMIPSDPAASTDLRLDPRLTLMGRFLLRARMNTLPQIFNVLAGDMSIVGPVPVLMAAVHQDHSLGATTRTVAPGMICVSELPLYDDLCPCERHGIASAYSQNLSFGLDAKVILYSVRQLVWPRKR